MKGKGVKNVEKAYEITDARIRFVSLVDKAANGRTFLITKQGDGTAAFTTYGRIVKTDAARHYVTGIVYEPMTEDTQGNFMTEDEIAKAAYWYAKNGDSVDLQHSFEPLPGASVVESWVAKADFEVDGQQVRKGTWLMTVEVPDGEVWDAVRKGEITGFSMGGLGRYSEEDTDLGGITKEEGHMGLLKRVGKALGISVVEKGEVAEIYSREAKARLFRTANEALQGVLARYGGDGNTRFEGDEAKIREALEEYSAIITDILTDPGFDVNTLAGPVAKSGRKMSGANRKTLQGIYDSLGDFLGTFEDGTDDGDGDQADPGSGEGNGTDAGDGVGSKGIRKEEPDMTREEVEGIVREAKGHAYGVQKTAYKQSDWNFWAQCPYTTDDSEATTTSGSKTTEEVAQEVIAGKWGNGTARKTALEAAGYDYSEVQAKVNELMGSGTTSAKTASSELKVGDKVKVTGTIYGNGNGTGGSLKKSGATMYVSDIVDKNTYKYYIGVAATKGGKRLGWGNTSTVTAAN